MTKKKVTKKKKPAPKKTGIKKAAPGKKNKPAPKKKIAVKKKAAPKKKPVTKKAAIKKEPLPAGAIPLTIPLGNATFKGWLLPQEKRTTWGIPETFTVHITGQGADSSISIATGVWVMADNVPQQITDSIIASIEKFYNHKDDNG